MNLENLQFFLGVGRKPGKDNVSDLWQSSLRWTGIIRKRKWRKGKFPPVGASSVFFLNFVPVNHPMPIPMRVLIISILLILSSRATFPSEISDALSDLDSIIAKKEAIESAKKKSIAEVRDRLSGETDPSARYDILDELFRQYFKFNIDSAIHYGRAKLDVAVQSGEWSKEEDAICDLSDRYIMSGMYKDAVDLLSRLDSDERRASKAQYYHLYHSLYKGLASASDDPVLRKDYTGKIGEYRQLLLGSLGDDDISKLYVSTEILIDEGKYDSALEKLQQRLSSEGLSTEELAILNYIVSNCYRASGDADNAIKYLAKSASYDLQTPVYEYRALYELAALLYERGDVKRAYNYIRRSMTDTHAANARTNMESINRLLPVISQTYEGMMRRKNRLAICLLVLMGIAAASLLVLSSSLSRAKKLAESRNHELMEANNIKEFYLGRYLDMCSSHIGGLEEYRSLLKKASKEGMSQVTQALKSSDFIDAELERFYAEFDATFLDIYPDFVEQFNALLQPDKRVKPKEGLLTTELRVFALIRLGINDSVKIAQFLRRSVSTIYNYRVKMRNASLSSREDFEKQVMEIGKL